MTNAERVELLGEAIQCVRRLRGLYRQEGAYLDQIAAFTRVVREETGCAKMEVDEVLTYLRDIGLERWHVKVAFLVMSCANTMREITLARMNYSLIQDELKAAGCVAVHDLPDY